MLDRTRKDDRVLVGPETSDDAGVYRLGKTALVATADFITPVCDDPVRFGRVAAANSLSDVYAMGGRPIFALNLCCFPDREAPPEVLSDILRGAAEIMDEADAVLLGGHTVRDAELKFGLAVVGTADPERLLTNAAARPGDRLILTKPLGTGVLINAYRKGKLADDGLEPALREMERLNDTAAELALKHGARAATDITGFGFAGHALEIAAASGVALQVAFSELPVHERFHSLVEQGVTTGSTEPNRRATADRLDHTLGLDPTRREVLYDPQTSGGLLLSVPDEHAGALLAELQGSGLQAAEVGEVVSGPPRLEIV